MSKLTEVLLAHQFLEAEPPGLYPYASTVCGCGQTPASPPEDGDWEWWVWHVSLLVEGRTPAGYTKDHEGKWIKVHGEERT